MEQVITRAIKRKETAEGVLEAIRIGDILGAYDGNADTTQQTISHFQRILLESDELISMYSS